MEASTGNQANVVVDQDKHFRMIGMELLMKATITAASIAILAGMAAALMFRAS